MCPQFSYLRNSFSRSSNLRVIFSVDEGLTALFLYFLIHFDTLHLQATVYEILFCLGPENTTSTEGIFVIVRIEVLGGDFSYRSCLGFVSFSLLHWYSVSEALIAVPPRR
jgi:hypothetical protein